MIFWFEEVVRVGGFNVVKNPFLRALISQRPVLRCGSDEVGAVPHKKGG